MSTFLSRPSKLGAVGVAVTALALVVVGGSAAQAYPPVAGNSSGGCTPAAQTAEIPNGFSSVTCTFTFKDENNQPAVGIPFSATKTGSATQGATSTVTDANGQATVVLTLPACSAVVTNDNTTVTGTASPVSTNVTFGRTCSKTTTSIASATCVKTSTGNTAPRLWTCSFTVSPAAAGYTTSVAIGTVTGNATAVVTGSDATTNASGVFQATVSTTGSNGAKFTVVGTVATTSTASGSSGTTPQYVA